MSAAEILSPATIAPRGPKREATGVTLATGRRDKGHFSPKMRGDTLFTLEKGIRCCETVPAQLNRRFI